MKPANDVGSFFARNNKRILLMARRNLFHWFGWRTKGRNQPSLPMELVVAHSGTVLDRVAGTVVNDQFGLRSIGRKDHKGAWPEQAHHRTFGEGRQKERMPFQKKPPHRARAGVVGGV